MTKAKKSDSMLADSHWFTLTERAAASLGQEIKMWVACGVGGGEVGVDGIYGVMWGGAVTLSD